MDAPGKPILCLDFDGVLHAYTSGWRGIDVVADGPVPGAMAFLAEAIERFDVHVNGSRSREEAGREAMRSAIAGWSEQELGFRRAARVFSALGFPEHKPPAFLTLDDRALTFDGAFPPVADLLAFAPWHRRDA